jgi:hypothetical protein
MQQGIGAVCPECGTQNKARASFCEQCGANLSDAAQSASLEPDGQMAQLPQKKKSIIAKLAYVAAGVAIFAGIFDACFYIGRILAPMLKYNDAADMEKNGRHEYAIEAYIDLGDYKDARSRAGDILSAQVESLLNEREYDKAEALISNYDFPDMADIYKGVRNRAGDILSVQVESLLNEGEYDEAEALISNYDFPSMADIAAKCKTYVFNVGDCIAFGGHEWLVLNKKSNKALLISKNIIDMRKYQSGRDRSNVTWENCVLRQWLNNDFYNEFGAVEKVRILDTIVSNEANPWFDSSTSTHATYSEPVGGNNTVDRFFPLSIAEALQYFGDSGKLAAGNIDGTWVIDDDYNDARTAYYNNQVDWWWLRSPGEDGYSVAYVNYDGGIDVYGSSKVDEGGVRPAFWLSLK